MSAAANKYSFLTPRVPRACFLFVALVALLVIAGWHWDIPTLKTVLPGLISMKVNTAIGLGLLASAGLLSIKAPVRGPRAWLRNALALSVALLSLATLYQYLFGINLGIDEFFYPDLETARRWPPGRFAPVTAINFLFLAGALLLDNFRGARFGKIQQAFVLAAWVISFQALVGYMSGVSYNFGSAYYTQIALHSALLFVILAAGFLLARPTEGFMMVAISSGPAGRACRRLLAAGILIPPITHYLQLQGVKAGLWDEDFGVLIRVVGNVVFFTWVALHASGRLYEGELSRAAAEEERQRVMEALERAVKARDELLSVCSHEMRTPLTSMKLANQMTERQIRKGNLESITPEKVLQVVTQSSHQINRLMKLIEEMLDFSRITEGRLQITKEPNELRSLLEDVLRQLCPELEASGCRAVTNFSGEVHGVWDRFRIEQVVINLLGNSMKYGKGKPIHLKLWETEANALISVADEGCGVAPADIKRVFEPYERAASVLHVTGLGLGLYISREIVAAHGGRIWMESKLGEGSTVCVELPKNA